jgi:hypothetical protein
MLCQGYGCDWSRGRRFAGDRRRRCLARGAGRCAVSRRTLARADGARRGGAAVMRTPARRGAIAAGRPADAPPGPAVAQRPGTRSAGAGGASRRRAGRRRGRVRGVSAAPHAGQPGVPRPRAAAVAADTRARVRGVRLAAGERHRQLRSALAAQTVALAQTASVAQRRETAAPSEPVARRHRRRGLRGGTVGGRTAICGPARRRAGGVVGCAARASERLEHARMRDRGARAQRPRYSTATASSAHTTTAASSGRSRNSRSSGAAPTSPSRTRKR